MTTKNVNTRNFIAFWIFGLCNNFGFVMMLSAAQDILAKNEESNGMNDNGNDQCVNTTSIHNCTPMSTGVVLLCNIFPGLLIKAIVPFFIYRIPYSVRHSIICISTVISFLLTAFSENITVALIGIMITSFANGLGDNTYLSLSSHYSHYSISGWSCGTGASGLISSFVYASLTDPLIFGLSSSTTMLISVIIPIIFAITYHFLLIKPSSIQTVQLSQPSTWISLDTNGRNDNEEEGEGGINITIQQTYVIWKGLLIYIIPIGLVYYAEYFINQGMIELTVFDCDNGYGTTPKSQYKWYQVLYQVGVFISRSSSDLIQLSLPILLILPVIQLSNVCIFLFNAIYSFIPNFFIACILVIFEGLIGGSSYVHSFKYIHRNTDPSIREFALGACTVSDGIGILLASLTSIPAHNYICRITTH